MYYSEAQRCAPLAHKVLVLQDFDGQAQVLLYHLINNSIDGMAQEDSRLEAKAISPGRFQYYIGTHRTAYLPTATFWSQCDKCIKTSSEAG